MKTFKRGVHPRGNKELTKDLPLWSFPMPKDVYISLSQHIGAPAELVVAVGDKVKAGTLVGKAKGFVSANVFSSVSGEVKGIVKRPNVFGMMIDHVYIENDFLYEEENLPVLENPTKEEIIKRVSDAGIVGMGGATFPAHVKFQPKEEIDYLIVNGAECEPYLNCDYRLMLEHTDEIIEGALLIKKALNAKKVYIGVENNKKDAINLLKSHTKDGVEIYPLKTKYPQGAEKQLIYALTKRKVECGKLPASARVVVSNIQTVVAVRRAVVLGRPSYERTMTISGLGVEKKANIWIKNGVTFEELFNYFRGSNDKEIVKVISGGPMMGRTVPNLDLATIKGTSALLFMTKEEVSLEPHSDCINCGKCAQACPMSLMPMFIDQSVIISDAVNAKKYGAMNCILCGSCAFACPAKRPLVQNMKEAKKLIQSKGV